MSFFNDMKQKLGGGGDFAYAYVIAHEIGHHVQNLLGILGKAQKVQQDSDEQAKSNAISVQLELQADCFRRGVGRQRGSEIPYHRGRAMSTRR